LQTGMHTGRHTDRHVWTPLYGGAELWGNKRRAQWVWTQSADSLSEGQTNCWTINSHSQVRWKATVCVFGRHCCFVTSTHAVNTFTMSRHYTAPDIPWGYHELGSPHLKTRYYSFRLSACSTSHNKLGILQTWPTEWQRKGREGVFPALGSHLQAAFDGRN